MNPNQIGTAVPRLDAIDTLRGLSILSVILLHIFIRMTVAGYSFQAHLPPWLFHFLFRNGDNGVYVFFAISGFLITSISMRRFGSLGKISLPVFYRIRFARIAPLLFLVLLVLSILHLAQAPGFYIPPAKTSLPRALFAALTFHLNWLETVRGYLPPNWDVLWSLSIEEAFYLFFPLACLLTRSRSGKRLFFVLLLSLVAAGPFARTIWEKTDIAREKAYLGGTDCIALGCLAAMIASRLRESRREPIGVGWWLRPSQIIGAVLIFFIAFWPRWAVTSFVGRSGLDGTILALGTCLIAIPAALKSVQGWSWTSPLRWFGRNSYEVYMTHEFVVVWAVIAYAQFRSGPRSMWILCVVLLSGVLGAAVARYYSEPLNRNLRARNRKELAMAIAPALREGP